MSRTGRVLATAATLVALATGSVAASATASAAETQQAAPSTASASTSTSTPATTVPPRDRHHYVGHIAGAFQYRDGAIRVSGFMADKLHPRVRTRACIYILGRCARWVHANKPSPAFDKRRHIGGRHGFALTLRPHRPGVRLVLRSGYQRRYIDGTHAVSPGARIVRVARRYVGDRYVWGAASPRVGFDCSGYAMYSYQHGRVARLPHNSNAQRFAPHMHRIARRDARPGDLVFYLSGGQAYHVAIFGGHGMQYSATDPAVGVQYAHITAHNIVFGTDWHR